VAEVEQLKASSKEVKAKLSHVQKDLARVTSEVQDDEKQLAFKDGFLEKLKRCVKRRRQTLLLCAQSWSAHEVRQCPRVPSSYLK
jgi:hypothetical protein